MTGPPEFLILTAADCRAVLARNHLGRLAFFNGETVDIEPIGYALKGHWLYARSAWGAKIESLARRPFVALEVDEVDGPFDWRSVVVYGTIYELPLDGSDLERRGRRRAVSAIKAAMPGSFTGHDPVPERQIVYGLHIDKLAGRMARRESRARPAPRTCADQEGACAPADPGDILMLVDRHHYTQILTLSTMSAVLAGVASVATLLNTDIYDGVIPAELLLGSVGFDAMSLVISVVLVACLAGIKAGHDRWWLVWTGLQGYLLYAYALYAFGLAYTPLYLMYIAIVALSAFGLALFWRSVNPRLLQHVQMANASRRTMGTALLVLSSMFTVVWIVMLAEAIVQAVELPAATVIVLDLAFTLPLLAVVGVLLVQQKPMGYLLAPGAFGLSAAITLGVAFGEFARPLMGGEFSLRMTMPYLIPGLICFGFSWLAFHRIGRSLPRHTHPHSSTTPSHPHGAVQA